MCGGDAKKLVEELQKISKESNGTNGSIEAANNLATTDKGYKTLDEAYRQAICCNFYNSSGTVEVSAGADVTLNQEKSSGSNKFNLYSTSYDEPFTLPVSICLNPCVNYENMDISVEQTKKIQKWLSLRNKNFKINIEGYENIYLIHLMPYKRMDHSI